MLARGGLANLAIAPESIIFLYQVRRAYTVKEIEKEMERDIEERERVCKHEEHSSRVGTS